MSEHSRYIVGLDLGTTNSAIAYVDTTTLAPDESPKIEVLPIPQLVAAGEVGEENLLPSFLFLASEGEFSAAQLQLPWSKDRDYAVGKFAREHGSLIPTRLVSSSKSWLCQQGVDRQGKILPFAAEEGFRKLSPVDAACMILEHLRDAWNYTIAGKDKTSRLENQEVILTVPASFDAVARELTMEAAQRVGLKNVILFEEPQAAFYSWLHHSGDKWRKQVKAGDVVLVVDVGGGTTDLTLIGVSDQKGDLSLNRIAVGDHLLLGGDNMDLTLAHHVAQTLESKTGKLDTAQMLGVWHACRSAKEKIFASDKVKSQPVTVLGRGKKVIGGTIKTDLAREDVEKILVDGFFPNVAIGDLPFEKRGTGLSELGLSYASDPAVTKHISAFLTRHAEAIAEYVKTSGKKPPLPTAILFNGGVFEAQPLRDRVFQLIKGWTEKSSGSLRELPTIGLDRAVAVGATYYGLARRGKAIRIRGGVARSYYIGVETAMPAIPGQQPPIKALCVLPQGTEEGTDAELANREFGLRIGEPVRFRFLCSSQRRNDTLGQMVADWEDTIEELAPIETTMTATGQTGKTIPVRLHSKVTDIGTLELWCQARDTKQKWKLEFNVREPEE